MKTLVRFIKEEDGMTVPEYAMIACLITLASFSAVTAMVIQFMSIVHT